MGVYSDGSYNVPAGLIYSFPVTCANGEWKIVQGKFPLKKEKLFLNCFCEAYTIYSSKCDDECI